VGCFVAFESPKKRRSCVGQLARKKRSSAAFCFRGRFSNPGCVDSTPYQLKLTKPVQLKVTGVADSAGQIVDNGNATADLSGGASITSAWSALAQVRADAVIVDHIAEHGGLHDLLRRDDCPRR
jgi:hypothetical protein